MKIHHVGYLVKNIEKAITDFKLLGYEKEGNITYDPLRDIDILFLVNSGYRIELVEPKSNQSVVYNTLKKVGNSPYHICYECDDIEVACQQLKESGYIQTSEIEPDIAISENSSVVFLFKRNSGIIELVETSK